MILCKRKWVFLAAVFYTVVFSFAQNPPLEILKKHIENKEIESSKLLLSKIKKQKLFKSQKASLHYWEANLLRLENKDDQSYKSYLASKELYSELDSIDKVAQINVEIVSLLLAIDNPSTDYNLYINEFLDYAKKTNKPEFLSQGFMQLGKSFYNTNPVLAIYYFQKAAAENQKTKDEVYGARIWQNMGATFASDKVMKLDSALYLYEKALKVYKKNNLPEYVSYIYINKGVVFTKKKQFDKAIQNFMKADSIPVKEFKNKNKEALYGFMANTYKEVAEYKKALEFVEKQKVYQEILNEKDQKKAIEEISVKYKTKEREKENQSLKQKLLQNKIALTAIIIALFFSIIIGLLAFKNISKKKKIASQEKLLEIQKLEKKLKENEINEIDRMLEGQEKERQKIANELHDNLGSLLATLKFNFQAIKNKGTNEELLFLKTDSIIDEAYNEVRNIAHLKNFGIIGKEGLLVSVKKMAEKMSVRNKTMFNVIPFGLNERLEGNIERVIFRFIQELCTNCIKYANASEVNIYLNQHGAHEINIIVEDNGIGFNSNKTGGNQGMGLKNIEAKVEQLNGTFTVDSGISKGTTIIIELPL
ncbi:tetratricopeptide repeat-containing sensor histidine kinase [Flavobacterium sp.]|uniref:tetratricopeptide repeat-containing sensor histidine kinase n=1 Tax=Flavobacterium sp. TaxID=239 RepID=UPI003D6BBD9F